MRRAAGLLLLAAAGAACGRAEARTEFSGRQALEYVRAQVDFGPRVPGTDAHRQAGDWLAERLAATADTVIQQRWTHVTADGDSLPMRNIIARFRLERSQRVLFLAHWDTRPEAEKDPDPARRSIPIPGANDGGSGVAILLGLADVLAAHPPVFGVDLLLVDGEDYGQFGGDMADVLIGSRYFAANLPNPGYRPLFGVLFDMVGGENARFDQEGHSLEHAPEVVRRVWRTADELGYSGYFLPRLGQYVTDDHLPLIEAGMRVISVVDIDFPHHHTHEDTLDKISHRTLQAVGDVAVRLVR